MRASSVLLAVLSGFVSFSSAAPVANGDMSKLPPPPTKEITDSIVGSPFANGNGNPGSANKDNFDGNTNNGNNNGNPGSNNKDNLNGNLADNLSGNSIPIASNDLNGNQVLSGNSFTFTETTTEVEPKEGKKGQWD